MNYEFHRYMITCKALKKSTYDNHKKIPIGSYLSNRYKFHIKKDIYYYKMIKRSCLITET